MVSVRLSLPFLPARRYSSAGTSYGPVSLSVCLSVTSQCSIKKDGQMNMLFGMKASFGHVLHCVLRKLRYLQK